jgi:pyruvate-ferredoxin/flavodoxin oxidoreductase
VQAYFVYDSKKAGTITTSHLRFGKETIRSPYLVSKADFIACHNFTFLEKCDMLSRAKEGATFLLCSLFHREEVWDRLPVEVQQQIIDKKLRLYVINAVKIAEDLGLGGRIMSSCRPLSSVFPRSFPLNPLFRPSRTPSKSPIPNLESGWWR